MGGTTRKSSSSYNGEESAGQPKFWTFEW
jgi:hypothetical protein